MIALLSFHRALNFGAVLQITALYTVLDAMSGHRAVVLDHRPKHIEKLRQTLPHQTLKQALFACLQAPNRLIRCAQFNRFIEQNLKLTPRFTPGDLVIVGSDQVWNPRCTQSDISFLLDFVPEKQRASYAASFGANTISEEWASACRKLFPGYAAISIREPEGVEFANSLLESTGCNFRAECHIDPAALLTAQEWERFERPLDLPKNYILLYTLAPAPELTARAQVLSQKKNLPIAFIGPRRLAPKNAPFFLTDRLGRIGPAEWLWLVHHASHVCTHSFHGALFSLIFKRPLELSLLPEPSQVNGRLTHLAHLAQLQNNADGSFQSDASEITQEILKTERNRGLQYLSELVQLDRNH